MTTASAKRTREQMNERNLANELALLATEVDSITKTLVQREAELADERTRRRRVQAEAARDDLRGRLEQKERERQALEINIRELMANLRHAAVKAGEAENHNIGAA